MTASKSTVAAKQAAAASVDDDSTQQGQGSPQRQQSHQSQLQDQHQNQSKQQRQGRTHRGRPRHRWFERPDAESSSDDGDVCGGDADDEQESTDESVRPTPSISSPVTPSTPTSPPPPPPPPPPSPSSQAPSPQQAQQRNRQRQSQDSRMRRQPWQASMRMQYGSVLPPGPEYDSESEEERRGMIWAMTGWQDVRGLVRHRESSRGGPVNVYINGASTADLGNWRSDYDEDEDDDFDDDERTALLGIGGRLGAGQGRRRIHWDDEALVRRYSREGSEDEGGASLREQIRETALLLAAFLICVGLFVFYIFLALKA